MLQMRVKSLYLDFYYEARATDNPLLSTTLVVCLKVAHAPSPSAMDAIMRQIPLMDPRRLPPGERVWTCRVWVKEALQKMHNAGLIRPTADIGK